MTKRKALTIGGILVGVLLVFLAILTILGPRIGNTFSNTVSSLDTGAPLGVAGGRADSAASFDAPADDLGAQFAGDESAAAQVPRAALPEAQERLIIRSADLSLTVDDTQATIDRIAEMAEGMGGFVVNSSTFRTGEGALRGDIAVRVPAERFDDALEVIKSGDAQVDSENISGQDVTEEYVDLQARLGSLRIAEQRLLEIMANAQNTSDLLQAEAQLTQRQATIESIEGRLQFLEQSAALSRISVNLTPSILARPVEVNWQPLRTARNAIDSLGRGLTGIVDVAIFFVLAVIPRLALIAVLLAPFYFVGRALWRRRQRDT